MDGRALNGLKALLWFVCASHIAMGAAIMCSHSLQQKAAVLYGATVDWTPQFIYILRPLGAFMFGLGVVGIAAARDPLRYRMVVYGFAIVLAIRMLQRIIFLADIEQAFNISGARNLGVGAFFLAIAVALVALMQMAGRRQAGGYPAAHSGRPGP